MPAEPASKVHSDMQPSGTGGFGLGVYSQSSLEVPKPEQAARPQLIAIRPSKPVPADGTAEEEAQPKRQKYA